MIVYLALVELAHFLDWQVNLDAIPLYTTLILYAANRTQWAIDEERDRLEELSERSRENTRRAIAKMHEAIDAARAK